MGAIRLLSAAQSFHRSPAIDTVSASDLGIDAEDWTLETGLQLI